MGYIVLIVVLLVVGACGGALILANNPNLYAKLRGSRGTVPVPPAPAAKHVISGTVRTATGSPLAGVIIATAPVRVDLAVTGADGMYVTPPLDNGIYQLEARLDGYTFTPIRSTVVLGAGLSVPPQDFTASA